MLRVLAVFFLCLLAGSAEAAVTANSAITPQTPNRGVLQFTSSSTAGTYATLYTAGSNGSKCNALWETNNDASAVHVLTIQIVNGGTKYGGTAATTTSNQGFVAGTAPLTIMTSSIWPGLPLDAEGNEYLLLVSGDTLQVTFATAITASAVVNLVVSCADF